MTAIELKGLDKVGLYRISPKVTELEDFKLKLEKDICKYI
jgi:hypothetical protein